MFRTCQYIAGDPTPDDSCKCGRATKGGSAWCDEHRSVVYQAPDPDQDAKDFALFFGSSRFRLEMFLSRASIAGDFDRQ